MNPTKRFPLLILLVLALAFTGCTQPNKPTTAPSLADAPTGNPTLRSFYERVRPALVAVQYEWANELAKQQVIGAGICVRDDGLIMIPMTLVATVIPDAQMQDFKIIIPSDTGDEEDIDATFVGRDERSDVAFVQAKPDPANPRKWTAIHFVDKPLTVGQTVYGVGILPKSAGYKAYLAQATVAAQLRGEVPQLMIAGGLSNVGSPVFDEDFDAIGFVAPQEGEDILLDSRNQMNDILVPPHFFVPTRFFAQSLADPPTPEHPIKIAWIGVPQMTGVNDQFAQFLGLKNQPAVQIGDVVPGAPAEAAGLQPGSIVIAMNGKNLHRGDLPEELPMILRRDLLRLPIGSTVNFTVLPDKGVPPKTIAVTLGPRPRQPNEVDRYYAQDLGFVAREAVFIDNYTHKMKPDAKGVVVDLLRRDGAAATAKLAAQDWIMQLNGQPTTDLTEFKKDYQAFRKDHPRDEVVLVVHRRGGQEATINIEPPQTDATPGGDGAQ